MERTDILKHIMRADRTAMRSIIGYMVELADDEALNRIGEYVSAIL